MVKTARLLAKPH
jgi:hypothetical protein